MANIALNKTATASGFVAPFTPARGVDGSTDPRNRWLCSPAPPVSGGVPSWLCVDLGANFWVNRWVVKQMGLLGWQPAQNYNMVDYKLQGSLDNVTWTDFDSVTNNSLNSTDRTFTARKARYVRVYVTKGLRVNTTVCSISEFELYEAPPTPNTLSGLAITGNNATVPTTPAFSGSNTSYTATVTYDVANAIVAPTATDANATITVNGIPVARGGGAPVPLTVGCNTVTVVVTPTIGDPLTYTIALTRASSQYLYGFTLKVGKVNLTYVPAFCKTDILYNATAPVGTTSIVVTPITEDPAATVNVNGTVVNSGVPATVSLTTGANIVRMTVTSSIGAVTKEYDVCVTV